jgi:hypothetical protein
LHAARLNLCLALILGSFAGGCSTSAEYQCPEPIGRIIRDDCEVYRIKYETLQVELEASLGSFAAKTIMGQQSLRDPSELLQVLAHRTNALCRDFNACRVSPLEYRQQRESMDRTFTAIAAIQGQLKGHLDAASREGLLRELVHILSEDRRPSCGESGSHGLQYRWALFSKMTVWALFK